MTLGDRIKKGRHTHSLSQTQLAKEVNVSRGMLIKYELDQTIPNAIVLRDLAISLKTTTDYLVNGDLGADEEELEDYAKRFHELDEKDRRALKIIIHQFFENHDLKVRARQFYRKELDKVE